MSEQQPYPVTGTASYAFVHEFRGAAQAAFLAPHLRPGMSLIDCGCGPGTITIALARAVAPGQVVGVDTDGNRIEQARATAAKEGVENVRFEMASVFELPFPDNSFDAAFEHTLFQWLKDPVAGAEEILRVLKPGGVFGAGDQAQNGNLHYGLDPALWDELMAVNNRWQAYRGGDLATGERLRGILLDAGFERIEMNATYSINSTTEDMLGVVDVLLRLHTDAEMKAVAIERGWADAEYFKRLEAGMKAWAENPGSIWAVARCQALGWKPA
jgi:ubiquinone/menaquinone biosynthesis C-methylase UbiE